LVLIPVRGKDVVAVIRVKLHEQPDLPKIVQTRNALSLGLGPCQCRQQHRRQDSDNRYHHQ
jgi:hypothetical protein